MSDKEIPSRDYKDLHAEGSLAELETQPRLASELGFLDQPTLNVAVTESIELQKMLKGLRRSLTTNH